MNSKGFVKNYLRNKRVFFTTPSHGGKPSFKNLKNIFGKEFFKFDLSETDGFDNLANPEGIIFKMLENSAKILNVGAVFYLINGSTSGILAAMNACLKPGDKVLIARNCHKSVCSGLIFTGANPIWIFPEYDKSIGAFSEISPKALEKNLSENPDIKAFILTSPTYEGFSSDIKSISEICRKHDVFLIVDEAHGALKYFAPEIFGYSSISAGADIAVTSLHKSCGAPNPCALLCINEKSVFLKKRIQESLNLINTSSPSYPLVFACFETVKFLSSEKGKNLIKDYVSLITNFKNEIANYPNIRITGEDISKIIIGVKGLKGKELSEKLDKYNIEDELATDVAVLCQTGVGLDEKKIKKLKTALIKINSEAKDEFLNSPDFDFELPQKKMLPREAFYSDKITVDTEKSEGMICAKEIYDYPPGIPFVIPGEIISPKTKEFLLQKGIKKAEVIPQILPKNHC